MNTQLNRLGEEKWELTTWSETCRNISSSSFMARASDANCVNSEFCTHNANRLFNQRCQLRILHANCLFNQMCQLRILHIQCIPFTQPYTYICQLRILHTQYMPLIQPYTRISTQNYAHSGDQFYTGLTYNSLCDASPQWNPLGKHSLSLNWPY